MESTPREEEEDLEEEEEEEEDRPSGRAEMARERALAGRKAEAECCTNSSDRRKALREEGLSASRS